MSKLVVPVGMVGALPTLLIALKTITLLVQQTGNESVADVMSQALQFPGKASHAS
jgi:hypothetical protein